MTEVRPVWVSGASLRARSGASLEAKPKARSGVRPVRGQSGCQIRDQTVAQSVGQSGGQIGCQAREQSGGPGRAGSKSLPGQGPVWGTGLWPGQGPGWRPVRRTVHGQSGGPVRNSTKPFKSGFYLDSKFRAGSVRKKFQTEFRSINSELDTN